MRHQLMRSAGCCLVVGAVAVAGELPHKWHSEPVTSARMASRIARAAESAKQEGRVRYAVLYDIGYPQSVEEYNQLGGCAVLYLAALTQEKGDLPITRAYVVEDARVIELW